MEIHGSTISGLVCALNDLVQLHTASGSAERYFRRGLRNSYEATMSGNGGNGRLVLFDLDATLFDHQGSLAAGMASLQRSYSMLAAFDLEHLIDTYKRGARAGV